jgi:2-amino-4-hydroxy-6-hydroxymethyldihydropteridine diphosphokinase
LPELAFISIGSNIEPEKHLPLAVALLPRIGELVAVSTVYQNPAVGPTPQADFLNAAALVRTELPAESIHRRLRAIEAELGRQRTEDKYAPRTIDLDLSLLGDQVMETTELTLPDPELLARPHLAIPLAELAPDYMHPVTLERLHAIADRLRPNAKLKPRPDVGLTTERA